MADVLPSSNDIDLVDAIREILRQSEEPLTVPKLRERLRAEIGRRGGAVFFPDPAFCTDNGAMIALVGALRLETTHVGDYRFTVKPRWPLEELNAPVSLR